MKSWVVASVALLAAGVMVLGTLSSPRVARATPFLVNSTEGHAPARTGTTPTPSSLSGTFARSDPTPTTGLPVVPITVGTSVEDAERQLAMRTLEAYAGDRIAACAALGVDLARLDELLGGDSRQTAVPHN